MTDLVAENAGELSRFARFAAWFASLAQPSRPPGPDAEAPRLFTLFTKDELCRIAGTIRKERDRGESRSEHFLEQQCILAANLAQVVKKHTCLRMLGCLGGSIAVDAVVKPAICHAA